MWTRKALVFFFAFIASAMMASGQPVAMTRVVNSNLAITSVAGLPAIPGAAIQVVSSVNGSAPSKVVFYTASPEGEFLVIGNDGNGNHIVLGSWAVASAGYTTATGTFVIQAGGLDTVLPGFPGFVSFEVLRQDGGALQGLTAPANSALGPTFQVSSVTMTGGHLVLVLAGSLSSKAVVQVGGNGAFAVFTPDSSGGGTAVLSQSDTGNFVTGATTVTVCDVGVCGTTTVKLSTRPPTVAIAVR